MVTKILAIITKIVIIITKIVTIITKITGNITKIVTIIVMIMAKQAASKQQEHRSFLNVYKGKCNTHDTAIKNLRQ